MAVIGAIQALFTSDTTGWTKGANTAIKDLDRVGKKSQSHLKSLKGAFGEESAFGQTMKMAAGAGAVAGLAMAGRSLNELTGKMVELRNQMNEGTASAGDMVEEIAKGIPVYGQFWQAGRNIRELFTGEQAEIAAINKEADRTRVIFDSQAASAKELRRILAGVADESKRVNTNIAKMHEANPYKREGLDMEQAAGDQRKVNSDKLAKDLEALTAKSKPAIDELKKARDEIGAKLDAAQADIDDVTNNPMKGGANARRLSARMVQAQFQQEYDDKKRFLAGKEATFAAEKKKIEAAYSDLESTDTIDLMNKRSELAEREREAQSKASQESAKSLIEAEAQNRIAALRAAGHEELAAIQQINNTAAAEKAANLQAAQDKLKELGQDEGGEFGKSLMGDTAKRNAAIDEQAKADIAAIGVNKTREVLGGGDSEIDRVAATIAEYKRLLDDGIITTETFAKARHEALDKFRDGLLPKGGEESAFTKYKKDVEAYAEALKKGFITTDQFKNSVAEAQAEMQKQVTPEFKANESQVRRFSFGKLSTPEMASPLKDMLAVTKDAAATQREIKTAIDSTNRIITENLKIQTVSAK